ncbi:SDR family NAD(P)-dependent oxidoreductase [Rhodovulum sp. DZ06]|uniref:SDR family NAD(P)-dependent oxidoreductase n=1 Tax=Rhodovulum sp. DZ06 TaxID=3425126 RepID=UPI003D347EAA
MDPIDLTGKVALITGASRGIGAAAAWSLAEAGASVVLTARSAPEIEALAAELRAAGYAALAVPCDVSDYAAVEAAVKATTATFGRLDILLNNAGLIDPIARLVDSDPAGWTRVIDVNVNGVYHGIRAAAPAMVDGGIVINISSGAATGNLEGWTHYCASKAAVLSLTRGADLELKGRGIRVVGLSPGTVATQMQREIKASGINPVSKLEWEDHIPPEWVGKCVVWLCGDAGEEHAGGDVSLRADAVRDALGLPRQ